MTTHKTLVGEFVNLRPLQVSDAELTYNWRDATRAKFLNQGAANVEQQAAWIASRPGSEYNFVIELKNGLAVGMVSLTSIDTVNRRGESGRFLIGEEDAVKGTPAAVEAMKLIYELAFDQLGLIRVCGTVAADNHLMTKWQKYLGMKEEGRLRNHLFLGDGFQDAIFLGLLVEEYRKISLPRMNFLISAGRVKN
jgi:RimJ/RimL family protein N-acetyltransferase